jgi:hypothetical protein
VCDDDPKKQTGVKRLRGQRRKHVVCVQGYLIDAFARRASSFESHQVGLGSMVLEGLLKLVWTLSVGKGKIGRVCMRVTALRGWVITPGQSRSVYALYSSSLRRLRRLFTASMLYQCDCIRTSIPQSLLSIMLTTCVQQTKTNLCLC